VLTTAGVAPQFAPAQEKSGEPSGPETPPPALRIGLLTDVHYADIPRAGTRYYRHSIEKVREAIDAFTEQKAQLLFHLGDLIDAGATVEAEIEHLKTIERELDRFSGERHYVLGNHCIYTLTKQEYLDNSKARAPHYSFDAGGFHFVVLDACYRQDGAPYGRKNYDWTDANIHDDQQQWLAADLAATEKRTVVLAHHRLDVEGDYAVRQAPEVRQIIADSDKVLAVLMGHYHRNDYRLIDEVHYCTLAAVIEGPGIENGAHALLDITEDGTLRIDGFRKQKDYTLGAKVS
jgi:alkaline phosphatase